MATFGNTLDAYALDPTTGLPLPGVELYAWADESGGAPLLSLLSGLDGSFGWEYDTTADGQWVSAGLTGPRVYVPNNDALASRATTVYVDERLATKANASALGVVSAKVDTVENDVAGRARNEKAAHIFPVTLYGTVDTTGTADSSTAINAAITACQNAGGGTVLFPSGTIRWDSSPTLPRSGTDPHGAGVKYQADMALVGAGSIRGSLWGTGLQSRVGTSATVLRMGQTTGVAQIDTRGTGVLRIRDLCLYDPSPTPVPFIQTTNTMLVLDNVSFFGNPATVEQACVKDAIILGGTDTVTQSDNASSFFQGYGTHIRDCYFSSVRRGVYGRNAVNGIMVTNPVFSLSCGAPAGFAAIEFDGTGLDNLGNCVVNPVLEMRGYVHTVRLGPHGRNTFVNPGFFDPSAGSVAAFYLFGGSGSNEVFGGNFQTPSPSGWVAGDGNAANQVTIHLGGAVWQNYRMAGNKATVQPFATQANTATLFEVKRSTAEATSPDLRILNITNEGGMSLGGIAPLFSVGSTQIGNSGIVRSSGDLDLYAGAATNFTKLARGHFQHTAGATGSRPNVSGRAGVVYFDTTLNKPIWSTGASGGTGSWVDATGTTV